MLLIQIANFQIVNEPLNTFSRNLQSKGKEDKKINKDSIEIILLIQPSLISFQLRTENYLKLSCLTIYIYFGF